MRTTKASRLKREIRERISSSQLKPGDKLPTVRELMATYEISSTAAVDKALRELVSEGLLTRVHGTGVFVRKRHLVHRDLVAGLRIEHERAMSGDLAGGLFEKLTGTDDLTVTPTYSTISAPKPIAEKLGIEPGADVLERTFRYVISGTPHQMFRSYMRVDTAHQASLTGPSCEVPGTSTMAQLHSGGIDVDRVSLTLETRMPTANETDELAIPPGTPVYEHWRVMHSNGGPVEVSTAVVPGDRVAYTLDVDLTGGAR